MTQFRLLTYNVRRCLGVDGELSTQRIARVIASCRPDIVALQELDVGRARTARVDQAQEIAAALNMRAYFHPALKLFEELYGDAVMTALPSELIKADSLPSFRGLEPRGAIWIKVSVGGNSLHLVNTHLGLTSLERRAQVQALLGPEWIGSIPDYRHLILTGDFNCIPRSRTYRRLTSILIDGQAQKAVRLSNTYPSGMPLLRIDYVFLTKFVHVAEMAPIRTPESRLASDHLPLQADLHLSDHEMDVVQS